MIEIYKAQNFNPLLTFKINYEIELIPDNLESGFLAGVYQNYHVINIS